MVCTEIYMWLRCNIQSWIKKYIFGVAAVSEACPRFTMTGWVSTTRGTAGNSIGHGPSSTKPPSLSTAGWARRRVGNVANAAVTQPGEPPTWRSGEMALLTWEASMRVYHHDYANQNWLVPDLLGIYRHISIVFAPEILWFCTEPLIYTR